MPSSTSSSDAAVLPAVAARGDGAGRGPLRAPDRGRPARGRATGADSGRCRRSRGAGSCSARVLLLVLLLGGWESVLARLRRAPGHPQYLRTVGHPAPAHRCRRGRRHGAASVPRAIYFDVQLPVWERLAGKRPIQLSFEGTSPLTAVEDLAADAEVHRPRADRRRPRLFFSGFAYRGGAVRYTRKESPVAAHRPVAVDAPHRAVPGVLRSGLCARHGARAPALAASDRASTRSWTLRKLAEHEADRNTLPVGQGRERSRVPRAIARRSGRWTLPAFAR